MGIETTIPTILPVTPAPTTTPTPRPIVAKTTDPDPIIDCNFTHIGTMKLRRSICAKSTDCQLGDKWVYYDSVDKCRADQRKVNIYGDFVTSTYQPTSYYTCTLCYHYLSGDNCSAYNYSYKTKAECDAAQASIDATYYPNKPQSSTPVPTISPEQQQAAIEALAGAIQACWDSVNASYNQQVHSCLVQFGGASSASQACVDIVNQNRQRDLNACEGR